jgi:hypothetical protein
MAAAARARAVLDRTGLAFEGDPLDRFTLVGECEGVGVSLASSTPAKRPGPQVGEGEPPRCGLVRVHVPLPDQIVCRCDQADEIMGPLPAAPRIRTGYEPFDATYAVFTSPHPDEPQASYRSSAAAASPLPWARPAILDRMREFNLQWLRVHDGLADIALPPLGPVGAAAAAALGAAFAQAAAGASVAPFEDAVPGPSASHEDEAQGVIGALGVAALLGISVGWGVAFAPALRDLDAELACGRGGALVTTGCGVDGGVCLECQGGQRDLSFLHYPAALAFTFATVLLVGLAFVAFRAHRLRSLEEHA